MDMFEEARAIRSTMELCTMTQKELAEQLGTSQSYVANKLRLLNLSEAVQERIRDGGVSERHARALLRLDSEEAQLRVLDSVLMRGLTVRECEALVDSEVLAEVPHFPSRASALGDIESFRASLIGSVEILTSRGIDARARTNYSGRDMYITVCIKDI